MADRTTAVAHDGSLVDAIAEHLHAHGPRAVILVVAAFALALLAAGYLDGEFDRPLNTTLWRTGLLPAGLVAYLPRPPGGPRPPVRGPDPPLPAPPPAGPGLRHP